MKKNGRENTVRSKSSPDSRESLPTRTERMMGANHSSVRWFDGITRMGRIKGSMKKRAGIRKGDALPVTPGGRMPGVILYASTSSPRRNGCRETGIYEEHGGGTCEQILKNDTSTRSLSVIIYSGKITRAHITKRISQNIIT